MGTSQYRGADCLGDLVRGALGARRVGLRRASWPRRLRCKECLGIEAMTFCGTLRGGASCGGYVWPACCVALSFLQRASSSPQEKLRMLRKLTARTSAHP